MSQVSQGVITTPDAISRPESGLGAVFLRIVIMGDGSELPIDSPHTDWEEHVQAVEGLALDDSLNRSESVVITNT